MKSVNFPDPELLEYATQRAEGLFGGNFSAYVLSLIERERSLAESRRTSHDLEDQIAEIIRPFGGKPADSQGKPFDFEVPSLHLLIEAKSIFPRGRTFEYRALSSLQKAALTPDVQHLALVVPDSVTSADKERFKTFLNAGIEKLQVLTIAEFRAFVETLHALYSDPDVVGIADAMERQEEINARLRARDQV